MELYQLTYFLEVARSDGINAAARRLNISPPAISKAIKNLERELGTSLFLRSRQRLKLTEAGAHLLGRAQDLLALEARVRDEIGAGEVNPELVISGREILLGEFSGPFVERLRREHPLSRVVLRNNSGDEAIREVEADRAHIALGIQVPPRDWVSRKIGQLESVTCVGPGHPLYRTRGPVSIREVLKHGFVSPNLPLFGRVEARRSMDGWRDDVHPRRIDYVVESLSLIRKLLETGKALAYIPSFWSANLDARILKIEGCGFRNHFEVYASAKRAKDIGWLGRIFADEKPARRSSPKSPQTFVGKATSPFGGLR